MKALLLALATLAGLVGFALLPAEETPAPPAVEVIGRVPPQPEPRWEILPIPPYDEEPPDGVIEPPLPPLH